MKLTKAILAIFSFSLLMTALNTAGIFDTSMPVNDGMAINESRITELTTADETEGGSGIFDIMYSGYGLLSTTINIFGQIIDRILNIDDLLTDYGVPSYLVTLLYSMLILVTVMGLAKLITGRGDKGIE